MTPTTLVERLRMAYTGTMHTSVIEAADEIERLQAEVDRVTTLARGQHIELYNARLQAEADQAHRALENVMELRAALTLEYERLQTRVKELEADAGRYRWLRDMDEDPVLSLATIFTDCNGSALSISNRIDVAVDKLMKGQTHD